MSGDSYVRQFIGPQVSRLATKLDEAGSGPFNCTFGWITLIHLVSASTGMESHAFTGGTNFGKCGQRYAWIRYTETGSMRDRTRPAFSVQLEIYQDSANVKERRGGALFSEQPTLGVGLTFADAAELFCAAITDYEQAAR